MSNTPPPIPDRFAEYEIVRLLGRGGMGEVYLARHAALRRQVALKLLSQQLATVPEAVERFVREAQAASRIEHPCIVAVYEAGVHEGRPFIAMRYVEGATLAQKIAQARERSGERPAPGRESDSAASGGIWRGKDGLLRLLALFERLARALHLAHEAGLVHRDVKPANVLLGPLGEPVLVDFGLARLCEQDLPTLTRPGELVGTPAYMAPEQIRCQTSRTDRRADVYGLGVSLYECLTLRRPFDAPVADGLYRAILTEEPPDPRRRNPGISRDLCTVLLKTLEKDPARRYPTALELAEELRRVQAHEPIRARPPGTVLRMRRWSQRNPVIATAIAALTIGLVVASALLYGLWRERGAKELALEAMRAERDAKAAALQRAEGLRLAARSMLLLQSSPTQALLVGLESYRLAPTLEGRNAVLAALDHCHELLALRGHTDAVNDAAFSPDGARIATVSSDGTVRLWSAASGELLRTVKTQERSITSVRFNDSGTRLVIAARDDTVSIRDAETGEAVRTVSPHCGPTEKAVLGPQDALLLTASTDAAGGIWHGAGLEPVAMLVGHQGPLRDAAIQPGGGIAATVSDDRTCKLWSMQDGTLLETLAGHTDDVAAVAFDPSGTRVVTGSRDRTAMIWDLRDPLHPLTLTGHTNALTGVTFSPDGEQVATSSMDLTVRIWQASTGLELAVLNGHEDAVTSVSFGSDCNRLLTTSGDKTARVWDISRTRERDLTLPSSFPDRMRPGLSRDGRRVALCLRSNDVEVWDLVDRRRLALLSGHGGEVPYVAFDGRGERVVTCCRDGIARIWAAESGKLLRRLVGHTERLLEARFSADGSLVVTSSRDGTAGVWNAGSGELLQRLEGHGTAVYSAAVSPDCTIVLTGCRHGVARVWETTTGTLRLAVRKHEGPIFSVAVSPDGGWALTASKDSSVRLWDIATGETRHVLRGHQGQVRDCAFSADGSHILTEGDDGTARLWDAITGQGVITVGDPGFTVDGAVFLPQRGEVLALSTRGVLRRSPIDPVSVGKAMTVRPLTPEELERYEIEPQEAPRPLSRDAGLERPLPGSTGSTVARGRDSAPPHSSTP